MWARLDDVYAESPKVWALSDGAFRLHTSAINYCARLLTDGHLQASKVAGLVPRFRPAYVRELVRSVVPGELESWHEHGHTCERCPQPPPGDYYLHDFLKSHDTKAKRLERRRERAEAGRRGGQASGRTRSRRSKGEANAEAVASTANEPRPDPTSLQVTSSGPPNPPGSGPDVRRCTTCDDRGVVLPDDSNEGHRCPDCNPARRTA